MCNPVSPAIEIASPTLSSIPNKVAVPVRTPVDTAHATVPVSVLEGLSAGQMDTLKVFPKSPAHFATHGPFAAVLYAVPPCSSS